MGEEGDISYWKNLAETRQKELEELVDMSNELESALEAELSQANEQVSRLERSLKEREDEVSRAKEALKTAKQTMDSLTEKCSSLESCSGVQDTRVRQLETENEALESQLRIIQASLDQEKERADKVEEQLVFEKQEVEDLRETQQRLKQTINDLEADIAVVRMQSPKADSMKNKEQEERITQLEHENKKLLARIKDLEQDSSQNEQQSSAEPSADLSRLKEEMQAEQRKTKEALEQVVKKLETEKNELASKLATECKQHQQSLARLEEFVAGRGVVESKATADIESFQALEEKYQDALFKIAELDKRRETLEVELEHLRSVDNTAKVEGDLQILQEELAIERQQRKVKKEECEALMSDKAALQDQVAALEHQVALSSEAAAEARKGQDRVGLLEDELEEERRKTHKLTLMLEEEKKKVLDLEMTSQRGGGLPDDVLKLRLAYTAQLRANASLLTRLQKMRGNILVCCRVRPLIEREKQDKQVAVEALSSEEISFYNDKQKNWRPFAFDRVFGTQATQVEVNREIGELGIAESVLGGTNACIMAYGQTGSGKTYTMEGPAHDPGINVLTMRRIFELKEMLENSNQGRYSIRLAMVEIYNEEVRDLLTSCPDATTAPADLSVETDLRNSDTQSVTSEATVSTIRSSSVRTRTTNNGSRPTRGATGRLTVSGFSWVQCESIDKVESTLNAGRAQRSTAATNLNLHSSRSHLIIILDVVGRSGGEDASDEHGTAADTPTEVVIQSGMLFLVDLAGSERVSKSGVEGSRLDETKHINRSLSALGDVMEALDSKDRNRHIPYRNSKLTHLLQPVLGGSSRTVMILTVPPSLSSAQETLFSLQFAARARNIELGPAKRRVQVKNTLKDIQALKEQISELRAQKTKAESRVSELKRKLHLNEQSLAAFKSEGTKREDAQRKRVEQQAASSVREVAELRAKLQTARESLKEARAQIETEKRVAKTELKSIQKGKATAERKVFELSAQLDMQREELVRLRRGDVGDVHSGKSLSRKIPQSPSARSTGSTRSTRTRTTSKSRSASNVSSSDAVNDSGKPPLSPCGSSPPPSPAVAYNLAQLQISTENNQQNGEPTRMTRPATSSSSSSSSSSSTSSAGVGVNGGPRFQSKIPRPSSSRQTTSSSASLSRLSNQSGFH